MVWFWPMDTLIGFAFGVDGLTGGECCVVTTWQVRLTSVTTERVEDQGRGCSNGGRGCYKGVKGYVVLYKIIREVPSTKSKRNAIESIPMSKTHIICIYNTENNGRERRKKKKEREKEKHREEKTNEK